MEPNYHVGEDVKVQTSIVGSLQRDLTFTITSIRRVKWNGTDMFQMTLDDEFQVFEDYLIPLD